VLELEVLEGGWLERLKNVSHWTLREALLFRPALVPLADFALAEVPLDWRIGLKRSILQLRATGEPDPEMISIHSIFVGRPEWINDDLGAWESSIFRKAVFGPVELNTRGIVGDQVADTVHHGRPSQAVCVHPIEHYAYWNEEFKLKDAGRRLGPGSVGENWTIEGGNESTICVGDTYSIGSSEVQVSGPRGPCWKQERKLKLAGFLKRTVESLRTGFYVQVVQRGTVRSGDSWHLKSRPNPLLTVHAVNVCYYQMPEPEMVARILGTPEVAEGWKKMFAQKHGLESAV
jgi:MOSC domain-containing protein YiiM